MTAKTLPRPRWPSLASAHRMELANKIQSALHDELGGQCALCGETHDLEFNHIYKRDWKPSKLNRYRRMLRYRREAKEGLISLLCSDCNKRYRPLPRESAVPAADSPF